MTDNSDASDETDPEVEATEASTGVSDGEESGAEGTDEADQNPDADENEADENGTDETTPHVELDLYQISVRVSGQSTDELREVESTARRLMDYLIEQSEALEDAPDDRGLG
jgi:hypothetical protein